MRSPPRFALLSRALTSALPRACFDDAHFWAEVEIEALRSDPADFAEFLAPSVLRSGSSPEFEAELRLLLKAQYGA